MSATMDHFSPFADSTWKVLGFLACALDGKGGITMHASRRGLSLKMSGVTIASGKTARALCEDYDRFIAKVNAAKKGSAE